MASQKFVKVTLFFNCKLLYGGENKIFASKSEMVSKLTQISDGAKQINFINGRTVPFSKEFSMHFKWEEFATYRNNPFNYPNYAVFTDGTINRTFGYFVTSSNTKNLPSDTVELFFKYDSFINNSDVIKNLKNKPIERITLDGFKCINDISKYLIYNDTSSNDFSPNVLPYRTTSVFVDNYPDEINIIDVSFVKKEELSYCVFIKYVLDSTAEIDYQLPSAYQFPDELPLKTIYLPYCIMDVYGRVNRDAMYLNSIVKYNADYKKGDYTFNFMIRYLDVPLDENNSVYKMISYLDSKAISKTFTMEPINQCLFIGSDGYNYYCEIPYYNPVLRINSMNAKANDLYFAFFSHRKYDLELQLNNYYSINSEEFNNNIHLYDDDIPKIIFSIGALHVFPYNYYSLRTQDSDNNLIPLRNEGRIDDNGHMLTLLGSRSNALTFYYRASANYPKFIAQKQGSNLPITKNAADMYLMTNSNQIQNSIKYAQYKKELNDNQITANAVVGATGLIGSLVSLNIGGAITSAGKTITNTYFGYENEKLKLAQIIDSNKAKINDLKNTNGSVSVGEAYPSSRIIEENLPMLINYMVPNEYELELIALFYNKYGITYNTIMKECFEKNHENFDYYKFSEFDEQEIDIQPNDERKEVYNILISGVRIWYNLEKIGSENSYNQPLSFTEFIGGN